MCALISFVAFGCNENKTTPASVPPLDFAGAPAVVVDLAGAPPAAPSTDMAMAVTGFPHTATVVVGPNGSLSFSPATVDIAAGGTVTWNWAPGNALLHNVTAGDSSFASATQTSGSFSHAFPSAGSVFYFCTVHGRNVMNGTVNVH
jgi:plastocyanin